MVGVGWKNGLKVQYSEGSRYQFENQVACIVDVNDDAFLKRTLGDRPNESYQNSGVEVYQCGE